MKLVIYFTIIFAGKIDAQVKADLGGNFILKDSLNTAKAFFWRK